ncbi:MAG: C1 family peptidase [Mariniblastus sp.]|nr:C1 family peptidase [Mariniblastus sp.]
MFNTSKFFSNLPSCLVALALLLGTFMQTESCCLGQEELQKLDPALKESKEGKPDQAGESAKKKTQKTKPRYDFTIEHSVERTDVKSQDKTGTCWSFATASFIESELLRREKGQHDLSEMFIVKNIYREKANNYVLRQGKANFSQGALAHDFLNSAHKYGLVPEEVYDGREDSDKKHDHAEMEAVMKGFLEAVVKLPKLSLKWKQASDSILDTYLGKSPERFKYRDRSYSPKEFSKSLEFRGSDYVSVSSYTHHPFYEDFVLEIPDNFSNGSFQNLPIDDLVTVIDAAIENGFSVAWDGDVSEGGFSASKGIAVLPKDETRRDLFSTPGEELEVDQELRQKTLMTLSTTDDHLMHLVGISRDTEGNKYYVIKNSWGEIGPYKGYIHMSEAYVRLKTVAIIVHKDAMPPRLQRD